MTAQSSRRRKLGKGINYLLKKLWIFFAIALVLLALVMSLLRYTLPYLDNNKQYFEDYISREYSIALTIGELSVSWLNDGPAITLANVSIKNSVSSPLALSVEEVFLEVDFWASITTLKLQSNDVFLNKLNLEIDLTRIKSSGSDFPIIDALENVFLEQLSKFVVANSRLTLISQENKQLIDITKLSWLNKEKRHQGVGEFTLQGFDTNSTSFILDLYGNVDSYSGTLFAQGQDVNLSAWINEFTGLESQLMSSQGNFQVWAKIENAELQRIDGQILPTTFEWKNKSLKTSNSVKGRFAAIRGERRWDFSIDDLHIESQGNSVVTAVNGYFAPEQGAAFSLAHPISIRPLLSLANLYSPVLADTLSSINADASLLALDAVIDKSGLSLQADVQDISWQEHEQISGMSTVNAAVFWQGKRGKFLLSASDSLLTSQYYLSRALPIEALTIPIIINLQGQDLEAKVAIDGASIKIHDLNLSIDAQYQPFDKFLSLIVDLEPFAVNKIPELLPRHLLGDGTRRFLQNALMGKGQVDRANILWHGALGNFPYGDYSGVFQSEVSIQEADFTFSNGWPALSSLDIDLLFENKSLTMNGSSGLLDKVRLSNLQANIPELSAQATLTIIADGAGTSDDITSLMLQSSLADSLGQLLQKDVVVDGDLRAQLALYIPLNDGAKTRVKGEVYLRNNSVSIPAINLAFDDTNGRVNFDNEVIDIKAMKASFFGQAVTIGISGEQSKEQYSLLAKMDGNWRAPLLAQNVNEEFASFFNGSSEWQLDLALKLMAKDFTYNATLSSSLIGIEAALPKPFAKNAEQSMPLTIVANGDRIASRVALSLGDIAYFDGALAHQEKQFNRAHLALGNVLTQTQLNNRGLGFSISASFDEVIAKDWYPFFASVGNEDTAQRPSMIGVPERIFIDTQTLNVAGEIFNDVDITIKRLPQQWNVDAQAKELKGSINLFDDRVGKGVVLDAQYITIAKSDEVAGEGELNSAVTASAESSLFDFDPRVLPSIRFTCQACDIKGINLGKIELVTQANNDGLKISKLFVNNDFGSVSSAGQWYKRNNDHFTFLAGDVKSNDFGAFVNLLGFNAGIKDSAADVTFAFTWKDSPMDIAFENLDGQVNWSLGDGSLTELSDQGSRIFTLLSLNSLVRKLSLDFRDVFAKGFFYENMKGSVQIAQGVADTRDTSIAGAAGEIEIYGNTNLATQALNYNVSFAPNVTGNLPVLVYFFTVSPPTALAALAIDKVLSSAKVISNINYLVTGTISNPILTETGRQSTQVELPDRIETVFDEDLPVDLPPIVPKAVPHAKIDMGEGHK